MGGIRGITLNKIKILLRKITMKIPIDAKVKWQVVTTDGSKKEYFDFSDAFAEIKENPYAITLLMIYSNSVILIEKVGDELHV